MTVKTDDKPTLNELTTAQPAATDPAYAAWMEARVRRAIERDRENPQARVSGEEVRAHFARKFAADR